MGSGLSEPPAPPPAPSPSFRRRPAAWPPSKRRWAWRLWQAARLAAAAYLMVLLALVWLEDRLIFIPFRYPEGEWQPAGLAVVDAWFVADDGVRLHGWYLPHPQPVAYVLFCHGNAGNITHRAEVLRQMHHRVGAAVLVFDYRGYGKSEGSPNEDGVLRDARAARRWLAQQAQIPETHVVLMGESLGGAIAVHLAAELPGRALILENTFTSLPDVAAWHFPWLPVRWMMRSKLDALAKIRLCRTPLFQSHGDRDTIVPYPMGRRLFEAAAEPKQFYTLPGADHNDPHPPEYYEALRKFLQSLGEGPAP